MSSDLRRLGGVSLFDTEQKGLNRQAMLVVNHRLQASTAPT